MKIAIADDHLLIISSLEQTLQHSGYAEICGTYTTGAALIEGLKLNQPDILLLDYHLPDQTGAEIARYITYHYPEVKIIALTGFDRPELATEMLESGCMGYLLKSTANPDVIMDAIDRVNSGHVYLDNSIREIYASFIRKANMNKEDKPKLTHRELEILKEIAAELSNAEIAEKLSISKRTVENHRTSIMIKAGAKNTVGLIKFAIELKLI